MVAELAAAIASLSGDPLLLAIVLFAATFIFEDAATVAAGAIVALNNADPAIALAAVILGTATGDIALYGLGRWGSSTRLGVRLRRRRCPAGRKMDGGTDVASRLRGAVHARNPATGLRSERFHRGTGHPRDRDHRADHAGLDQRIVFCRARRRRCRGDGFHDRNARHWCAARHRNDPAQAERRVPRPTDNKWRVL